MSIFFVAHPKETDLALFAGGELGPFGRWRIERHLETCESCQGIAADFFHLPEQLAELAELPDLDWNAFAESIEERVAREVPAGAAGQESRQAWWGRPGALQLGMALAGLIVITAVVRESPNGKADEQIAMVSDMDHAAAPSLEPGLKLQSASEAEAVPTDKAGPTDQRAGEKKEVAAAPVDRLEEQAVDLTRELAQVSRQESPKAIVGGAVAERLTQNKAKQQFADRLAADVAAESGRGESMASDEAAPAPPSAPPSAPVTKRASSLRANEPTPARPASESQFRAARKVSAPRSAEMRLRDDASQRARRAMGLEEFGAVLEAEGQALEKSAVAGELDAVGSATGGAIATGEALSSLEFTAAGSYLGDQRTGLHELRAARERERLRQALLDGGRQALEAALSATARSEPLMARQAGAGAVSSDARRIEVVGIDLDGAPLRVTSGSAAVIAGTVTDLRFRVESLAGPIAWYELGWVLRDPSGRARFAAALPVDAGSSDQGSSSEASIDDRFFPLSAYNEGLEMGGMNVYVRGAQRADGSYWAPTTRALDAAGLGEVEPHSAELERLATIRRNQGLDAVIALLGNPVQ